jgi:hypothetical protein
MDYESEASVKKMSKSDSSRENKGIPKDHFNIASIAFFLFGIGSLLPWNSVLTAIDFFEEKLPDYRPSYVFGLVLNTPSFICAFFTIFLSRAVSMQIRIVLSFTLVFWITVSLPLITDLLPEKQAWPILVSLIVLLGKYSSANNLGISNAFSQGGIFGLASVFPSTYISITMVGQGFSGISLNFIRIVLLAIFPPTDNEKSNSQFLGWSIYFSLAAIVILLWIFFYYVLMQGSFAHYYFNKSKGRTKRGFSFSKTLISYKGEDRKYSQDEYLAPLIASNPSHHRSWTDEYPGDRQFKKERSSKFWHWYSKIWFLSVQITLCFAITFTVFPGTSLSTHLDFIGNGKK